MSVASVWRTALLAAFLLAGLTGCDYLERNARANEENEAHYIDGVTANKLHDYEGAIAHFENAIKANPNSGAAHRELALLYDARRNRHLRALYHYERFGELRSNEVTQVIRDRMFHCRVMVARENFETLERTQVRTEVEAMRSKLLDAQAQLEAFRRELAVARNMSNQVQILQQQLIQATNRVAQLQGAFDSQSQALAQAQALAQNRTPPAQASRLDSSLPSNPQPYTPQPSRTPRQPVSSPVTQGTRTPAITKPVPSTGVVSRRTHTMQSGETLSWIAKRYGVSLAALRAANPRVDPNRVRAGTVLVIP